MLSLSAVLGTEPSEALASLGLGNIGNCGKAAAAATGVRWGGNGRDSDGAMGVTAGLVGRANCRSRIGAATGSKAGKGWTGWTAAAAGFSGATACMLLRLKALMLLWAAGRLRV